MTSATEPAIIQNEQFHPVLISCFGKIQQLLFREIHPGRFPVIDQNRTFLIAPRSSCQPFSVEAVESLAHAVQTIPAVHHHDFRCLESFPRFKHPAEAERIDSHTDARNIVGIHLHLRQEITGIHETESQDLSGLFGGIRSFQSNERILVVAG